MKLNPLTPEEEEIIEKKGTEAPHSGEYDNFYRDGIYTCRHCGAPLYRSENKFDAHCGWPSFDAEIPGAIERSLDADGRRTEITCRRCGAHLGHVFWGEKMTEKDTRHCVNSLSMRFIPKDKIGDMTEVVYFGGGCFWCAEAVFKNIKGIKSVISGYAGGEVSEDAGNINYEKVSTGKTGHAEVVKITYDPTVISYEMLLNIFFATHDPTTMNRQGADVGTQYRSIILYENENQEEIAEKFIDELERQHIFDSPIVTEVRPIQRFFEAEDYHKDYYAKNPEAAYCQAVISPKVAKMREKFKDLIKK